MYVSMSFHFCGKEWKIKYILLNNFHTTEGITRQDSNMYSMGKKGKKEKEGKEAKVKRVTYKSFFILFYFSPSIRIEK